MKTPVSILVHLSALILSFAVWFPQTVIAEELPLENYFGSQATCYGRSYSWDHLKKHKQQKVIDIAISYFPLHQELLGNPGGSFHPYPETPRLVARLDVWLRDQDLGWQAEAICEPDGARLACALECDAGRFYLEGASDDRLRLTGGGDLYFTNCDAGDRVLMRKPDDGTFLLYPMPRSHCQAR